MNRDASEYLLWAGWVAAFFMHGAALFIGLDIRLVLPSTDWPAWVQAVGSVLAIIAAIWIDHGAGRRTREAKDSEKLQTVRDWESALSETRNLVSNASRIASDELGGELSPQALRTIDRLVDNAITMLDVYLRQPPPSARLVFTLSAARSHTVEAQLILNHRATLEFWDKSPSARAHHGTQARTALKTAADKLNNLSEEYWLGAF